MILFKMETQNMNGLYKWRKNCGWLKRLKLVRCCLLLPKSPACLNSISVYGFGNYAFPQVFTLCLHPMFVFSTSTRCNQLEKLGMCKLYCIFFFFKQDWFPCPWWRRSTEDNFPIHCQAMNWVAFQMETLLD